MMANIGFCGKLGVVTGFASLAVGFIDIIASAFHIKSDRMKDLQRLKDSSLRKINVAPKYPSFQFISYHFYLLRFPL